MRPLPAGLLAFTVLAFTGCGTIMNLHDAPNGTATLVMPGHCFPFGGVTRSGLCAYGGVVWGSEVASDGLDQLKKGDIAKGALEIGYTGYMSFVTLLGIVDAPLSLAGDIITYPLADARAKRKPWATWWGAQCQEKGPLVDDNVKPTTFETPPQSPSLPISP